MVSMVDGVLLEATRQRVLAWFAEAGRDLPWRATRDPYRVLVAEVLAQQTQAARAADAWERFLVAFPTPAALAAATPADALRAWRGLGYNRRALALRAAAIEIVDQHGGLVPGDLEALDALPGVGPYTARAVAALAFGARVGAVDTNVRRVLGRSLFDADATAGEIQGAADAIVPPDRPGEWTHALMDIGATFCRSRNPRCDPCPLQPWCRYAARRAEPSVSRSAAGATRRPAKPFMQTSRWLRGRILDRLRDAPGGGWVAFDEPIGGHPVDAVHDALGMLDGEAMVELRPGSSREARLPIA
jgi:A/G-specific adenine glycosylase